MLIVPLSNVPSQTVTSVLGGQNCQINVYQKSTGVYLDLFVNNIALCTTSLCVNETRIVRYKYLGFIGDLMFVDTEGKNDPDYTGIGSRYQLIYIEASDGG